MPSRPKPYNKRAAVWKYGLVVLIYGSLLRMGDWVLLTNHWAVIPVGPASEAASIINSHASASISRPLQIILGGRSALIVLAVVAYVKS
jgi:hypothetical protein